MCHECRCSDFLNTNTRPKQYKSQYSHYPHTLTATPRQYIHPPLYANSLHINDMSGQAGPSSMLSPTSPRTAKAGLFRARSPPVEQSFQPASFDLNTRIDPFGVSSSNGRFTPGSSNEGHSLLPPGRAARSTEGGYASSAGASVGHTPHLPHTTRVERPSSPPSSDNISPIGPTAGTNGGFNAPNRVDEDTAEERESSYENGIMGLAGRSDEMLMTLLAGQAAVDCEQLPIGGWEEVESWKKASLPRVQH